MGKYKEEVVSEINSLS